MGKPAATDRPRLTPLSHSFTLDSVVGFEYEADAQQFLADMRARSEAFSLTLHPGKTRLIRFGRYAALNRRERGLGLKPSHASVVPAGTPGVRDEPTHG